jgi:hypothetical protein
VSNLEPILEKLARAQDGLLRTADLVPVEQWKTRPQNGGWSAAEIVAHLIMIERLIIGSADRLLQKTPRHFSLLRRLHLPLALVEARVVRRKTPIPLDPELVREKEAMLAELRGVRERTLAFIDETKGRDLSEYCWPHPFVGTLNMYGWFELIAAHELRHQKQIRQIVEDLPKAIASLQK